MAKRGNQEWLAELRGEEGRARQEVAHEELGAYLYVVSHNYLKGRQAQGNPYILSHFGSQELVGLAQDFVQDTLVKVVRDDFALLDRFRGEGNFTGWMAVIVMNEAKQELRKSDWERRLPAPQESWMEEGDEEWSPSFEFQASRGQVTPEKAAMRQEVVERFQACLERLPESRKFAFRGMIVEGRSAKEVAQAMNRTEKAVFSLVYHAKRDLRKCLLKGGWGPDALQIFEA